MISAQLNCIRRNALAASVALTTLVVGLGVNEFIYSNAHSRLDKLQVSLAGRVHTESLLHRILDAESDPRRVVSVNENGGLSMNTKAANEIRSLTESVVNIPRDDSKLARMAASLSLNVEHKLSQISELARTVASDRLRSWPEFLRSEEARLQWRQLRQNVELLLARENELISEDTTRLYDTLSYSRLGFNALYTVSVFLFAMFFWQARRISEQQRVHVRHLHGEKQRLDLEVARRTEQLTELTGHLHSVREDERGHLARELHDELGALLTAAKLDAARLQRALGSLPPDAQSRLESLKDTVDRGIAFKRRIVEDLRPSTLDHLGLAAALEILTGEFSKRTDIPMRVAIAPIIVPECSTIIIYRLVQESLTNIAKHASATQVSVTLRNDEGWAVIQVVDNGVGFDTAALPRQAHGILGMKYRVEAQGGIFSVCSQQLQGTQVSARLPGARLDEVSPNRQMQL